MIKSLIELNVNEVGTYQSSSNYKNVQKRLADLSLTPGTPIKVVRKCSFHGPVEIEIEGSRLVLGRGLASKILVEIED